MLFNVLSWAMICLFGQVSGQADSCHMIIAIQPLGTVDSAIVGHIAEGITSLYDVNVVVLPGMEMPGQAYYKPGKRYRAEKILAYLDSAGDFEQYTIIVGITKKDISTTKGKYYDWGIFGLGYMPGRVSVVSTYRLGRKKVTARKFYERLIKVVNHELGHNFGLDHCPNQGCLMEDAKGTIKTVDNETGELCDECKVKVRAILLDSASIPLQ
jgi:archaemetzincin